MTWTIALAGAAFFLTVAGIIFKAGRIEARIKETQVQTKKDLDGQGAKIRKIIAEQIIQVRHKQDFEEIVRRLLG